MRIRPARPEDFERVLEMNAESVTHLSPLDRPALEKLAHGAHAFQVVERDNELIAFLIVFRDGAGYESENFRWFEERYERFLYVDRIVVDKRAQRSGAGSLLYRQLFTLAASEGAPIVALEIDIEPANPTSLAFHSRHGFAEVGQQTIRNGLKVVSMQIAPVVPDETHVTRHEPS